MEKKDLEVLADSHYFDLYATAKIIGYQPRTVRHFLITRKIKGVKQDGRWLFSGKEIKRFLNDYEGRKYSARIEAD